MKKHWFKERLVPVKEKSELWGSFADTLQDMWEVYVEPTLTRISNRKSFFTMDSEDMNTRIAEYGRFFVIREKDKDRRPMLLTQRLDEIHFKGTYQPIEQTFWREFEELPVTWEPLYGPEDQSSYPYGSVLHTWREVQGVQDHYGDFFLTSRGRIVIDLNRLGTANRDDAYNRVKDNYDSVIAPLIPLHIVFDGLTLQLIVKFIEQWDMLKVIKTDVNITIPFYEPPDILDNITVNVDNRDQEIEVKALPRSLEPLPLTVDTMPLDAWPLGITQIIPPIIPARNEGDTRLFTQNGALTRITGQPRLMLKTLGQYGCLVEYSDGHLARYGFPAIVPDVILQLTAGDWRRTIRKVNYLSSIDEVRIRAGLTEPLEVLRRQSVNEASSDVVLTEGVDDEIVLIGHSLSEDVGRVEELPRDLNSHEMAFDAVPIDLWLMDETAIIPPVIPALDEDDGRVYQTTAKINGVDKACVAIKTLGQPGCIIEYANGYLTSMLFPAGADAVVLHDDPATWREAIRKVSYSIF